MLKIHSNGRFLSEDGKPFFYLGDTAWELFHRLTREEADVYPEDRAAKQFNVIQAVALAGFNGLIEPNQYGDIPLHDLNPTRPNEAYFRHVDHVIERANALGMYVGLLPTWGDKWNKRWGVGPDVFTPQNARTYGQFIGHRYRDAKIIWILGGDRPVETPQHLDILRAMADGIDSGDGGRGLMTLHPSGGSASSKWVPDESWLDFHMLQSGHSARDLPNHGMIAADLQRFPGKPCLDGEPAYEDHPVMGPAWKWEPANGYFDDSDVRKSAYRALFAGACGHTYGCHAIWQFLDSSRHIAINNPRTPWQAAIHLPGAGQMQHARRLLESRPYFARVPVADAEHTCRDEAGTYLMRYFSEPTKASIDTTCLSDGRIQPWWFDPRTGNAMAMEQFDNHGSFVVPVFPTESDWVLVLERADAKYTPPGDT